MRGRMLWSFHCKTGLTPLPSHRYRRAINKRRFKVILNIPVVELNINNPLKILSLYCKTLPAVVITLIIIKAFHSTLSVLRVLLGGSAPLLWMLDLN